MFVCDAGLEGLFVLAVRIRAADGQLALELAVVADTVALLHGIDVVRLPRGEPDGGGLLQRAERLVLRRVAADLKCGWAGGALRGDDGGAQWLLFQVEHEDGSDGV